MFRYVKGVFNKVYKFYCKWGDQDAFFSSCLALSILASSTLNFVNSLIYFICGLKFLKFDLFPIGMVLVLMIAIFVFVLVKKKNDLLTAEIRDFSKLENFGMTILIIFMFTTWVLAPIFYKLGST